MSHDCKFYEENWVRWQRVMEKWLLKIGKTRHPDRYLGQSTPNGEVAEKTCLKKKSKN